MITYVEKPVEPYNAAILAHQLVMILPCMPVEQRTDIPCSIEFSQFPTTPEDIGEPFQKDVDGGPGMLSSEDFA